MNAKAEATVLERFLSVRAETENFTHCLEPEDYIPQPVPFVSPAKWHMAHSTWFFENFILKKFLPNYRVFNPSFHFLFNSYYQQAGKMALRSDRGNMTRPTVDEVYAYRAYVDVKISELMDANGYDQTLSNLVELGVNHEQQHQELLKTDVKYMLGNNPLFPGILKKGLIANSTNSGQWIAIKEGVYEIGHNNAGFCYDNELAPHKVYLHNFEAFSELVTNEEFIAFINDGGYNRSELWLDEGWAWRTEQGISQPMHWHLQENDWWQYSLAGLEKLAPKAPVCHVSFYEADAFARWKKCRLLTEFEWEIASSQFKWGKLWEWTNSAYLPYPGFKIAEGALGEYNGKFMINQMVLRGASCATSSGHSRKTYRNFFHPHYQWQFSGIRLAK